MQMSLYLKILIDPDLNKSNVTRSPSLMILIIKMDIEKFFKAIKIDLFSRLCAIIFIFLMYDYNIFIIDP